MCVCVKEGTGGVCRVPAEGERAGGHEERGTGEDGQRDRRGGRKVGGKTGEKVGGRAEGWTGRGLKK